MIYGTWNYSTHGVYKATFTSLGSPTLKWESPSYPLVNVYITMENHHVQRVNQLFLWPCSIAFCMFTRLGNQPMSYGALLFDPGNRSVGGVDQKKPKPKSRFLRRLLSPPNLDYLIHVYCLSPPNLLNHHPPDMDVIHMYKPFKGRLVAGLEHDFYFSIQLGMSSSQLTSIWFRGGRYTTNQLFINVKWVLQYRSCL